MARYRRNLAGRISLETHEKDVQIHTKNRQEKKQIERRRDPDEQLTVREIFFFLNESRKWLLSNFSYGATVVESVHANKITRSSGF